MLNLRRLALKAHNNLLIDVSKKLALKAHNNLLTDVSKKFL